MLIRSNAARAVSFAAALNLTAAPAVPAVTFTALLLGGCATSTTNGVTTVTLNVAQMNAWGQAVTNGADLLAGLPGFVGTPAALAIAAFSPVIQADMSAFNTAVNGQLTFTFDRTSPAASVTSLVTDAQKLEAAVVAAVPNIPAAAASDAQTYLNAIKTIVSLLVAVANPAVASAAPAPMTQADALYKLHVVLPGK